MHEDLGEMTTKREFEGSEGRLFSVSVPYEGWSISAQADKAGYQCSPKERLPHLEDYVSVEVAIYGPADHRVDLDAFELPSSITEKFDLSESRSAPHLGCNITLAELEIIKTKVFQSLQANPNAGFPPGRLIWSDRTVYHGTACAYADDIVTNGIDIEKGSKGYFGRAFYVADDEALARSNYADFNDEDEQGEVIEVRIRADANILDLRNSSDSALWIATGLQNNLGGDDVHLKAKKLGIDGVYDRSVGGLAIYNPAILDVVGVCPRPSTPGMS
jgi:hypothetical protein